MRTERMNGHAHKLRAPIQRPEDRRHKLSRWAGPLWAGIILVCTYAVVEFLQW